MTTLRATLLLGMALPALARAQAIRGTVVDAASAPVAGVIVMLLDQRDSVTARALTNDRGEFRVAAGTAGAYRLRTLRIGFRPTVSPRVALVPGQELVQQVIVSGLPWALDTVRVTGRNSCRFDGDSTSTTYGIWEQVRAALTATQLTTGSRGIEATLITYDRALDPDRERVLEQGARIISGLTRSPWTSPSADSLRRGGYVVSNLDGGTTYWAPDLRVLLSDEFIEDHCFELATSRDPTRIGLAFAPTRERRGKPGIRGTLWVDRKSAELRRMEFRYTNASREQEYGSSGGSMDFVRVKGGAWVISGWNIRMPRLVQRQARVSGFGGATVPELRVEQIRVEGGEVALVTRDKVDTLWSRPPVPLNGVVLDSATGARVADAHVTLRGTSLGDSTDASGAFRIGDVLPGRYTAEVRTRTLTRFGYVHSLPLDFIDSNTVVSIRLPSVDRIAQSLCPFREFGAAAVSRDGLIAGVVRLEYDTAAARDARVFAEWNEATPTGARFGVIEATTDVRGQFKICGLPLGTALTITATLDSAARGGVAATQSDPPVSRPAGAASIGSARAPYATRGSRRVTFSKPVVLTLAGARYASVELVIDTTFTRGATFSGVVLSDINGQPMPDVEVAITDLNRSVFTGENGSFRLTDITPGRRVVTLRRVGYALKTDTITFAANHSVERSLLLSRVATLDTVAVTEWRGPADFEEHRKLGLGRFLTRDDIDKMQGMAIANRLPEMGANLTIVHGKRNEGWVASGRANTSQEGYWCPGIREQGARGGVPCGCYARVFVDGTLMNPAETQIIAGRISRPSPPYNVNEILTMSIEAVEWYGASAQVPAKYGGNALTSCGTLVIHTRRGKK